MFDYFIIFGYQIYNTITYCYEYLPKCFEMFQIVITANITVSNYNILLTDFAFLNCIKLLLNNIPSLFNFLRHILEVIPINESNIKIYQSLLKKCFDYFQCYSLNISDILNHINSFSLNNELEIMTVLYLLSFCIKNNCYQYKTNDYNQQIFHVLLRLYNNCEQNSELMSIYRNIAIELYSGMPQNERDLIFDSFLEFYENGETNLYVQFYKQNNTSYKSVLFLILCQTNLYQMGLPYDFYDKLVILSEIVQEPPLNDMINLQISKVKQMNNFIIYIN